MKRLVTISVLMTVFLLSSCDSKEKKAEVNSVKYNFTAEQKARPLKLVDASYVCMTQNAVYPKKLIPVERDGKTYYGCCQGCAKNIKEKPEKFCYSKDPLTGQRVDKAEAKILNYMGKALYFQNENNARQFSIQHNI